MQTTYSGHPPTHTYEANPHVHRPPQLYEELEAVLFWLAILLGALLAATACVLVACWSLRAPVPLACFVPAPAIVAWMVSMGPVSYAAGVLFAGDVGQALLACLLLLVMLGTLCAALFMLRRWLACADASTRRALFVRRAACKGRWQLLQPHGEWWPHFFNHPWCAACGREWWLKNTLLLLFDDTTPHTHTHDMHTYTHNDMHTHTTLNTPGLWLVLVCSLLQRRAPPSRLSQEPPMPARTPALAG